MTLLDLARWRSIMTGVEGVAGRAARPEEIGDVVAFLAGAGYTTATTIFADGGIMRSGPGL